MYVNFSPLKSTILNLNSFCSFQTIFISTLELSVNNTGILRNGTKRSTTLPNIKIITITKELKFGN